MRHEVDEEFARYVRARQHRLLRAAYLVCGDAHLAEDLLQGALVKLAPRWDRVRDENPDAYVRRILYRDAVSSWRRTRRESLSPLPLPDRGHADRSSQAVSGPPRPPARPRRPHPQAAGGGRAALLRGPHRARDRRGPRLLGRHRQEPDPRRAGPAADAAARLRRRTCPERTRHDRPRPRAACSSGPASTSPRSTSPRTPGPRPSRSERAPAPAGGRHPRCRRRGRDSP